MKTLTKLSIVLTLSFVAGGLALAQNSLPSITIHSPVDGQKYNDEVVEFDVNVSEFTFVDFKNNTVLYPANPDAGHAHIWIESRFTGAGDSLAYKLLSADFHEVGELGPGSYRITVELVRNNEEQFEPRIFSTVTFSVGGEGIQTGRYSVKYRTEPGITYQPPRTIGISERLIAGIILVIVLIALYAIFRKKLLKYKAFRIIDKLLLISYKTIKWLYDKLKTLVKKIVGVIKRLRRKSPNKPQDIQEKDEGDKGSRDIMRDIK